MTVLVCRYMSNSMSISTSIAKGYNKKTKKSCKYTSKYFEAPEKPAPIARHHSLPELLPAGKSASELWSA